MRINVQLGSRPPFLGSKPSHDRTRKNGLDFGEVRDVVPRFISCIPVILCVSVRQPERAEGLRP
jgi:hypothetical protein